jgi:hypothetical protein
VLVIGVTCVMVMTRMLMAKRVAFHD